MPGIKRKLKLEDCPERGMVCLRFSFDREMSAALKEFPGVRFAPEYGKCWVGPRECALYYKEVAEQQGYVFEDQTTPLRCATEEWQLNSKLSGYQRKAVLAMLREKSWLVAFEMGLGKTPTAIEARKHIAKDSLTLVVCPSAVTQTWIDEFKTWWPGHPCSDKSKSLLPMG